MTIATQSISWYSKLEKKIEQDKMASRSVQDGKLLFEAGIVVTQGSSGDLIPRLKRVELVARAD